MKKIISKNNKFSVFVFMIIGICGFLLIPLSKGYSQNAEICGTYTIDQNALNKALNFEKRNGALQTPTPYLIRVFIQIIRDDNGTNPAATEQQAINELNQLISDYASGSICFVLMGIDYINSSYLNSMPINGTSNSLLQSYLVPGCLNLYYHGGIVGAGGVTFNPPTTYCSIKTANLGTHTTSHEVGHCFGLLHTFDVGAGYEKINGSNSTNAGDLIGDTPADPWAYTGQSCYPATTCPTYTGTCTDPNGQSNFSPPYTNIMAYWPVACGNYPNNVFTAGQFTRINSFLSTNAALQGCESSGNITEGPGLSLSSGYHLVSAINNITSTGSVIYNGSCIAALGAGSILLQPGFHADANSGASILIRASNCSYIPRFGEISNSYLTKETESGILRCFPNPTNGYVSVIYQLSEESQTVINLVDVRGRLVKQIQNDNIQSKGQHQLSFDLSNVPNGIYAVKMICNGKVSVGKLTLIH